MRHYVASLIAGAALLASQAQAEIVSASPGAGQGAGFIVTPGGTTPTGGTLLKILEDTPITGPCVNSNCSQWGLTEQRGITLSAADGVYVNFTSPVTGPGTYSAVQTNGTVNAGLTYASGGFLLSGITVDSHMIWHNNGSGTSQTSVTWTFDGEIVGFMTQANGHNQFLTDALFEPLPDFYVPASGSLAQGYGTARGMENGDPRVGAGDQIVNWTVGGNSFTWNSTVSEPGDWIRVFTISQVPEPASLALIGIGLLGLAGLRRR